MRSAEFERCLDHSARLLPLTRRIPHLSGHDVKLALADGSAAVRPAKDLLLANDAPPPSDVCRMSELNEATILKCIEERWRRRCGRH